MTAPTRAPGWHRDETDAAVFRYWDGAAWTPHTTARPDAAEPATHRTVRLADAVPDHTTVPTPPDGGASGFAAGRAGALTVGGTVTAGAALVVACAALVVALLT